MISYVFNADSGRQIGDALKVKTTDIWHLEYANSLWCPHKLGDIKEIEKVQKKQLDW